MKCFLLQQATEERSCTPRIAHDERVSVGGAWQSQKPYYYGKRVSPTVNKQCKTITRKFRKFEFDSSSKSQASKPAVSLDNSCEPNVSNPDLPTPRINLLEEFWSLESMSDDPLNPFSWSNTATDVIFLFLFFSLQPSTIDTPRDINLSV